MGEKIAFIGLGAMGGPMAQNIIKKGSKVSVFDIITCLLYTSPSPRDATLSRMPSSA